MTSHPPSKDSASLPVPITPSATSQQLAQILSAVPGGIYSCDAEGRFTFFNEHAVKIWGRTPELNDQRERYCGAYKAYRGDGLLLAPDETPMALALRSRIPFRDDDMMLERPDGSRLHVGVRVELVLDATGNVVSGVGLLQDLTARNITLQKQRAVEAVRQEKMYRAIGESIDYGFWICDATGRNIYASDSFLKLVGMTQEQCSAFGWSQLLRPEEIEPTLEAWKECVRNGAVWEREHSYKGTDGKWHPVLARGLPVRDEAGAIIYWAGINLDTSAFKNAEIALQRRTHVLEAVNRLSNVLVAEFDLERIVQSVTDAAREVTCAAVGAFFYTVVNETGERSMHHAFSGADANEPGPDLPFSTAEFAPTFGGQNVVRIADLTADTIHAELARRHGLARGSTLVRSYLEIPVISRSEEVLGGIFLGHPDAGVFTEESESILVAVAAQAAIAIDNANLYTALQRELDDHKRSEAALRSSEQQLRLITDSAMVYLAQCDREHRLKFVNRPYAARFGKEPRELVGKHLSELLGPEAYAVFKPHLDATIAGSRVEFEVEVPYIRLGRRWVRVVHEPERNAQGQVVGLVAVITDITARKQSEREMEIARDRAVAASRAKDEFLAALSHELRTPLNPVLLLASEAADDPSLPDRARADFDTIRKNVELEARLIDDLLDLTRITRGKLSLNLAVRDVHEILQDALATMGADVKQKNLELIVELNATDTIVWGDAVRLQQVIWNVLKNAVKFTEEGGRIVVRTFTDAANAQLMVQIVDTGIGMTAEELSRVFNAFSQGDHAGAGGSHRFGGVGLGLTISRMLIDLHHGKIRAVSEGRGRGSTFTIELPTMTPAERELHETRLGVRDSQPASPRPAQSKDRRRTILLVEDHEPTRAALAQLLKRRNYEVAVAGSVATAQALAANLQIDVLISDIGLPDGNGYELMADLKTRHKLRGIALTGYGMDHDVVRSQSAGFFVHLTKPVSIQSLDKALRATESDLVY